MSSELGTAIPALRLSATGDQTLDLANLDARVVVLYFYPKDSTPGCTQEGRDFAELHAQFVKAGARVLGVSKDSLRRHENFKTKQCFPFDLISDEEEALCNALNVIQEKALYGRKYMGIVRSTFLYVDGVLVQHWDKVKVKGHAQAVLEAVKNL